MERSGETIFIYSIGARERCPWEFHTCGSTLLKLDILGEQVPVGSPIGAYCFLRFCELAEAEEADPNLGAVNRDAQPTEVS